MDLKAFKEKDKKKIGIILFTITCVLLISGVILYRTFAIFETNDKYDVMNGSVEDPGDIYFAFYKDGVIQKEMPTKNEGYVLDENQSYCGVLGNKNPDIKVSMTEDEMIHILGVTTSRTKCNLYFVKGTYILGKGVPFVTEGNGLYEVSHNDEVTGTVNDAGFKKTEYRYAGENPNNYITFNDELWRIIGLVNVMTSEDKVEQRVKIVRNDSIGEYSWDTSLYSMNTGYGMNEWSKSDLMKLLNPGFEKENFNNSLYWNKTNGSCYNERNEETNMCEFEESGISDKLKNMIEDVTWNTSARVHYNEISTKTFYNSERSYETGDSCKVEKGGKGWNECNDTITRNIYWKGKIALMYPSDYGYATGSKNRNDCLNVGMNNYGNNNCHTDNWMYQSLNIWLLTANDNTTYSYTTFYIEESGRIGLHPTSNANVVKPALYLNPNVKIFKGNGELKTPFIPVLI